MNATDCLLNYLQNEFSTDDCVRILKENNLYYSLGERFVELTEQDVIDKNNNMIVSKYNFNVLSKIIKEFNKNNIEAITFKGTTLSYLLFGVVNKRMPGDIDLFTSDYNRALETLIRMGFYFPHKNNGLDNQHHIALTNGTAIVELHKNIFTPTIGIDETVLRSSVECINIMSTSFCTFTKSYTFLHLLYHLYMDTCLTYSGIDLIFYNKQFPEVKRFIYRAYEIALFSEKYFNEIDWMEIEQNISSQKFRILFKKIIVDIHDVFPMAFPQSFVKTVDKLDYIEDGGDKLSKESIDIIS